MFTDIKIKQFYNTYNDNIAEEFYVTTLKEARVYNRVCADFSSKALASYANGIVEMYKNKGKINFIISKEFKEDYKKTVKGYINREEIEQQLIEDINEELTTQEKMKLSNFAFLIENKVLDIKIAFIKEGSFQNKFGLMYDEENNCIYFRDSNNETVTAINKNYESFAVLCNWKDNELESNKIFNAEKMFKRLWNNDDDRIEVIEISEVIRRKLMKFNKGKIFKEKEIELVDTLYVDLNDCQKMIIKNNLEENKINITDRYFQIYLNRFLKLNPNNEIEIKNVNNYLDMKKLIKRLMEYSKKNSFNINISKKILKYIESKDMQIEERRKLGIDIKNKESYLKESFEEFKEILNNEMERKLRTPQLWDAFHIVKLWKAANFSVPGAGKTSIVYGAYAFLSSERINKVDKIVMIGPKNSFYAWKEEFAKNFGSKKILKVLDTQDELYQNSKKKIIELRNNSGNKNLILINYESLPALEEVLKEILNDRVLVVFDEIHKIKGIEAIRAGIALSIASKVKYKVALTGTPIPNGYQDIYNILKILYSDEYDTIFGFKSDKLKSVDNNEINEKIYPFYCRTTKKELEIPKANDDKLIINSMTCKEKILFEYIHKKYRNNILALYIRLMQASTNPKLLLNKLDISDFNNIFLDEESDVDKEYKNNEEIYEDIEIDEIADKDIKLLIDDINSTSKFYNGINLIKELIKEKKQVLVWGIFTNTLEKIKVELELQNVQCDIIDGKVPYKEREKIINKFKNKEINVLIANPNTLAESVSLHECCHDAIYFEYSFNLTHMIQSKDRINRLGLNYNQYTQYYYLMLTNNENERYNSIDEKTYYRLKEKEKIMIDAIEGTKLRRIEFDDEEDLKIILNKN